LVGWEEKTLTPALSLGEREEDGRGEEKTLSVRCADTSPVRTGEENE
tara:strand:- start:1307 stop:1447 length:141 start_codon:yes stop_codon:yes gene_type:complete